MTAPPDAADLVAEAVVDAASTLGEGPIWDADTGAVVWLDLERRLLHSHRPADGAHACVELPQRPGAIVPRRGGGFAVAAEQGFFELDGLAAPLRAVAAVDDAGPGMRMNDGACDPQGRFWAGTAAGEGCPPGSAALYRLDRDRTVERVLSGVTVSNGLAWSLDGATLYYVDTATGGVDAFDFDARHGRIANRRRIVSIAPDDGYPDGMTIDADGCLWVALWGAGAVRRYAPDGRLDAVVRVPAGNPTSCCFGGPALDELYITSARAGLSASQLAAEPLAGALFRCRPGVRGLPTFRFG